jgi:hypothetical protein
MNRKELVNNYLFVSINSQSRQVKLSAVTNIDSFRNMMRHRYGSFEIINDNYPLRLNVKDQLVYKLMDILKDCRITEGNAYRTYDLDSYRVQTVIKLITGSNNNIQGIDLLKCHKCNEQFEADYKHIKSIYDFIRLDFRYCSDKCDQVTRAWSAGQRYCRCGDIFYPKDSLDYYCPACTK